MRILIVKTSSLGDVIHTLPALTDAVNAVPGLTADWVVEESFAEVPAWHPAVAEVIPVAIRRWRKNWMRSLRGCEISHFRRMLKARRYDAVIDAQGLMKSALISWQAHGPRNGLDKNSIREPLSSRFYQHAHEVSKAEHAVQRVRQLFAKSLGYHYDPGQIDYGLALPGTEPSSSSRPQLIFLHGTTWASKHWPEPYWRELMQLAVSAGYQVCLPWGDLQEQERAMRLAHGIEHASVLEKLSLTSLLGRLQQSVGVVAVDTGLGHLAAALGLPTVSLYGATNPALSGTFGHNQLQLKSDLACSPCLSRACQYRGQAMRDQTRDRQDFIVEPPCYRSMPPSEVMGHLTRMIETRKAPKVPEAIL